MKHDPIIHNFRTDEKHACFLLLSLIIESSDVRFKEERNKVFKEYAKMFRVFPLMFQDYVDNVEPDEIASDLRTLSDEKIEYLIVVTHSILSSTVITEQDLINSEELFFKLAGVDPVRLHSLLGKLMGFKRRTTPSSDQSPQSTNTASKVYDRMTREAEDPNQSTFSLNNIVFFIFTALAILGLLSLFS